MDRVGLSSRLKRVYSIFGYFINAQFMRADVFEQLRTNDLN